MPGGVWGDRGPPNLPFQNPFNNGLGSDDLLYRLHIVDSRTVLQTDRKEEVLSIRARNINELVDRYSIALATHSPFDGAPITVVRVECVEE